MDLLGRRGEAVTWLLAAGSASAVFTITLAVALSPAAPQDPTSFLERRLALAFAVLLVAAAATVPAATWMLRRQPVTALGVALAGIGTCVPLWAALPTLPPGTRALTLAVGPLAIAGLALVAGSLPGAIVAGMAAALHASAYNPFDDVGCARTCLAAPPAIPLDPADLAGLVAALTAVSAVLTTIAAAQARSWQRSTAALGTILLALVAAARWQTVGDADAYGLLLVLAPAVPLVLTGPLLVSWARRARQRRAAQRLVEALREDPMGLRGLEQDVDPALLTPGPLLALRTAQLADLAQQRVDELRASQRRLVAASDAERRRIERDLHDGAQQRLVGVLMHLEGQGLDDVENDVRRVLSDLRTLGASGFPDVLDEEGLGAALEELALISTAHIQLRFDVPVTVPAEHARAVYSLAVASAHDGDVALDVALEDEQLQVRIRGTEAPDVTEARDRFGALGGTVTAQDGQVVGVIPCE